MKKGLLISTTLAMLLGVGVAVGAHQAKGVEEVKAWSGSECGSTWYIIGTINGQNWNSWNPFTLKGNRYEYTFEDATQVEFKLKNVQSWQGDIEINAGYGNDLDWAGKGWTALTSNNGGNFKTKAAGKYTVYYDKNIASYENGIWAFGIEEYQEPVADPVYKLSVNGGTAVTLTKSGDEFVSTSATYHKGDVLTFTKDSAAYAVAPKDSGQQTKVYAVTGGLKFAEDYTGVLYLDPSDNVLWAGQFTPGYYLAGVGGEWEPKLAVAAQKESEGDAYVVEGVTLAAGEEVKFINFPELGNTVTWFKAKEGRTSTGSKVAYSIVSSEGSDDGNFKVTNAGTYNLYFNPDGEGWYSIENPSYVETHVLTIGGKNVNMTKDGNQWKALGVALTAGDTVTAYTIDGVAETVTAQVVGNNNLDASKKVLISGTFDIYYHTDDNTLWISGLPMGGYHLYLNNNSVVQMTSTDPFGDYQQFKTESVSFVAGDIIKILDANGEAGVSGPVVWAITKINEDGLGANFEVDEGAIKCKTACSASVYLKILQDNDEIYFGARAEHVEKAVEYVNGFKSAMAGACSAENKESSVKTAWATQASTYKALDKSIRDDIYEGGYSSVAEIREFGERYMAIQQQHADWKLENFLEWEIPAGSYYSGLPEFDNKNNAFIVVAVIASITTLSTAVLLVIKKRKRQ